MKKIELCKRLFSRHSLLWACPICDAAMSVTEPASLKCEQGHSFDLAKQGYVNLTTRAAKASKYDRELFQARLALNQTGFFAGLVKEITTMVLELAPGSSSSPLTLLDAGCGEGSHLASIVANLGSNATPTLGVGLDIAKDGVRLAAGTYPGHIWCVADLAQAPFRSHQFDVILNILSPANYSEFRRLLRASGILIKAFPGDSYLAELRTALYAGSAKERYSNESSRQQFSQHFTLLAERTVYYQQQLNPEVLENLLRMTPLAWSASPERLAALRQKGLPEITIEAHLLAGRP
ncbi:MAG: methyltransferase domain-containing protein [Firmicutes bacterium]|jgi:23S rRNA (guanine745-N1)-methyltransferase|nr:methyltransferase domain-containing protein [Bacillota bacterium]